MYFAVFNLFCLMASLQAGETIQVLGQEASGMSVIAKLKTPGSGKTPAQLGLGGDSRIGKIRSFRNIPSLVVLDLPEDTATASTAGSAPEGTGTKRARREREVLRLIKDLEASGQFEYVEPDFIKRLAGEPSDAAFLDGRLWGLRNTGQEGGVPGADIRALEAWKSTTGSPAVVVAVIDTGIRYTHLDLGANMWVNPGEIPGNRIDDDRNGYVDDVHGINAASGSGDPMDRDGHGTHCAGTIGAVANGGGPHVGVAWNVKLMALNFFKGKTGSVSALIKCIDYAISKGAHIVNASYGDNSFSRSELEAMGRANAAGILFVTAAGNDGTNNDRIPHYPSNYEIENVIAVANMDRKDLLDRDSNFGAASVDLGAPGTDIFSTTARSDTDYDVYSGTSMATPHVTGVAALLKARFPNEGPVELKQRLLMGTRKVPALAGKCITGGALDAAAALGSSADGELDLEVTGVPTPARAGMPVVLRVRVVDLNPVIGANVLGTLGMEGPRPLLDNGLPPDVVAGDGEYAAEFQVPKESAEMLVLKIAASAPGKKTKNEEFEIPVARVPGNDLFAMRSELGGGTTSANGTNLESTTEPGEPIRPVGAGGATVWWSWTPSFTGLVTIHTGGSDFDTTLAVFTGSSLGNLVLVAENDDHLDFLSSVTLNAKAGVEYLIQVNGSGGKTGNIRLNYPDPRAVLAPPVIRLHPQNQNVSAGGQIQFEVKAENALSFQWFFNGNALPGQTSEILTIANANAKHSGLYRCDVANSHGTVSSREARVSVTTRTRVPANDDFEDAGEMAGASGRVFGNNVASSGEPGEPDHLGNADPLSGIASVWWKWVAVANGKMNLNTSGSDFDTTLSVYTGSAVGNLTRIVENDDGKDLSSLVVFDVIAGQEYKIAVDGKNSATGLVVLNWDFKPDASKPPANDDFEKRTVLSNRWSSTSGTNVHATGQPGEPDHAFGSTPIQSVWWSWRPRNGGNFVLDTLGSNFTTMLAVYTGEDLGSLQIVAMGNGRKAASGNAVEFRAEPGRVYHIAVDGFEGETGRIVLNLNSRPDPPSVRQDQSLVFEHPGNRTYEAGGTFVLSANASSGLPVAFTSSNTSVVFVEGAKAEIRGAGIATISATQSGNENFNAAYAGHEIEVRRAAQSLLFEHPGNRTYEVGATFVLSANASSGLPVAFTSSNTSVVFVEGAKAEIRGAGIATISATQSGNVNFNAAYAGHEIEVRRAAQSLVFEHPGNRTYEVGATFVLSANASSGLPVAFTSSNISVVFVEGTKADIRGIGDTILTAIQTGDANYQPSLPIQYLLTVGKPPPVPCSSSAHCNSFNGGVSFQQSASAVASEKSAKKGSKEKFRVAKKTNLPMKKTESKKSESKKSGAKKRRK